MKEYWFNVYDKPLWPSLPNPNQGAACFSREQANQVAAVMLGMDSFKTLYRIHVRLK